MTHKLQIISDKLFLTHKLQITRQHVSIFLLNMRLNQILLQVAAILLPVLLQL